MARYIATIRQTRVFEIRIEARSADEARHKADKFPEHRFAELDPDRIEWETTIERGTS